jgi:hypothetical protein
MLKPRFYDGPRMSDLAGAGEAAWCADRIEADLEAGRTVLGFQGWTHSPARLLRQRRLLSLFSELRRRGTAVALQVSVTGLGSTLAEPGIGSVEEELEALGRVSASIGIDWEAVCVRIDPLQRYRRASGDILGNLEIASGVLGLAASLGVRRFRTSLLQHGRYRSRIDPRLEARGLRLVPPDASELETAIGSLLDAAGCFEAELRSCASPLPGLEAGACFDPAWLRSLCDLPERKADRFWTSERPVAPRSGCLCASPADARMFKVPARSRCFGACAACYAQR